MLNLEKAKIDSLRIHIPMSEVTVTGKTPFLDSLQTVSMDTGEVVSEHIQTTHFSRVNGIAGSYAKLKLLNGIFGETEYLVLGFSAKMLKEEYFTGINNSNIKTVYDYLMNEGVVSFSFESFLRARVVDTDICQDYLLEGVECKEVFEIANQLSRHHKSTEVNHFKKDTNRGIQWGDRKKVAKAYKTKQYLKYYAKALELKYKSEEFYKMYLKDNMQSLPVVVTSSNLLRIETTIKNNAHWQTYGLQARSLQELLSIDLDANKDIFQRPIKHYMTGEKSIVIKDSLNWTDLMSIGFINDKMQLLGVDYEKAIEFILNQTTKDKYTRSKKKKYLTLLYEGQILAKGLQKDVTIEIAKNYNLIP